MGEGSHPGNLTARAVFTVPFCIKYGMIHNTCFEPAYRPDIREDIPGEV